jgi:mRNA deadenylase 3'-5' endonuclease subunit Ccr4
MLQHLVGPLPFPLGSIDSSDTISVLSWNILLPNSQDGWWTYKMYYPPLITEEERQYSSWDHRQNIIKERIRIVDADVVCFQEVSPLSFEQDFLFMRTELGYTGCEMFKKGRFRPATFWKEDRVELLSSPVHKDRTLLTAFRRTPQQTIISSITDDSPEITAAPVKDFTDIQNKHNNTTNNDTQKSSDKKQKQLKQKTNRTAIDRRHSGGQCWYVLNCHLQAGKQGGRRLRQINEGMRGTITLARKLQGKKYPVESESNIIVCGDFNGDVECGAVRFIEDGYVDETFLEDNEQISSSRKNCPLTKPMIDVVSAVNHIRSYNSKSKTNLPPATLVVTELISLLIKHEKATESTAYVNPRLSDDVVQRLEQIYNSLATGPDTTMRLIDVEKYLAIINGQVGRGDEFRAAARHMIASLQSPEVSDDVNHNVALDNDLANNNIRNNDDSITLIKSEERNNDDNDDSNVDDKSTRLELPKDPRAILSFHSFVDIYQQELNRGKFWGIAYDLAILGAPLNTNQIVFEGRYDRMYCSSKVQILCVQDFPSTVACPNQYEPSDHLPIAALFAI